MPLIMSFLVSNAKASSLRYKVCIASNHDSDSDIVCPIIWPSLYLSKKNLLKYCFCCNSFFPHSSSHFSAKTVITKRNSTRDLLYPCLTPIVLNMLASSFLILVLLSDLCIVFWLPKKFYPGLYVFLANWLASHDWLCQMLLPDLQVTATYIGKLCCLLKCSIDTRTKNPPEQLVLGVAPNLYLVPCFPSSI